MSNGCQQSLDPLQKVMDSDLPAISRIKESIDQHEVQILYTRIQRDKQGKPSFTEYSYRLNDMNYFYPASTAKLPIAILALQRLNALQSQGLNISKETPFSIVKPRDNEVIVQGDSTERNGNATIAHMIKKIFLVSDNDAYNHLFEFLGRDYINQELAKRSMGPAHINHKFQAGADNKNTLAITFHQDDQKILVDGTTSLTDKHSYPLQGMIKGVGYTDNANNLIQEPFDFSEKNFLSLSSLNKILKAVIFPESLPEHERFNLTQEDLEFLRFWMSRNALESEYPNYQNGEYWDSYVKFLIYGDTKEPLPKTVRISNKIGMAYGTLTDVAYVQDSELGIEFMLSATVLVNENQIFNDGIYEYDELGLPFLAELGRQILAFERDQQ